MKLAECRELKKGDAVTISLGNGWYTNGWFVRMIEVTHYPRMTFNDIKNFDMSKGRKVLEVLVEYYDDRNIKRIQNVNPRRIRRTV